MNTVTTEFDGNESPEEIGHYLAEPIAAAWRGFDRGRAAAEEFFTDSRRTLDAHMWAHIVRYEASLSLRSEPEPHEWQFRSLHHSGIELTQGPFTIRSCKAIGGGPQHPGRNFARREFFQQLGFSLFGGVVAQNLILYWRVNNGGDLELGLCKPKGLWRFKDQPRLEWRLPIAYEPLAGLSFPTTDDEDLQILRFDADDLGLGGS